ncbi:MAG TPA: hypothetical protein VNV66_12710 [Pilimelia sp.]|nr:hypothetical protein [Pilimelia sp.]
MRRRSKSLSATFLSVLAPVAAFGLLAPASPASAAPPKPPPAAPAKPSAADVQRLDTEAALQALNARAAKKSALGTYYDAATGQAVVAVPKSGAGSGLAPTDVAVPGLSVRVEKRNVTKATLDRIQSRITQRAWHPQAKQYAYGFYTEPRQGVTVVETNAPAGVVSPLLREFGAAVSYRAGFSGRTNRYDDPPPHWGAATVTSGGGTCTAGFIVKNAANTRFLVTAGHCFAQGATVRSGAGTYTMGTVVNRAPFPTWDLELIGGASYGTQVYRGNTISTGSPQIGAADPVVGFTGYCFNGQTTGAESCNHTVTSLSAQFCDAAGCTTSLIAFSGGASAPRPGDSGSPFYLPASNGVHARGIVIAVSGSTGYAERWNTVANHFGVSLVIP